MTAGEFLLLVTATGSVSLLLASRWLMRRWVRRFLGDGPLLREEVVALSFGEVRVRELTAAQLHQVRSKRDEYGPGLTIDHLVSQCVPELSETALGMLSMRDYRLLRDAALRLFDPAPPKKRSSPWIKLMRLLKR